MTVSIAELKDIANWILDTWEREGLKEVAIEQNFYWDLEPEVRYNVTKDPSEFSMGELEFEWQCLKNAYEETDGYPIPHTLIWLSQILRTIAENKSGSIQ